jgi:hypothetical protein
MLFAMPARGVGASAAGPGENAGGSSPVLGAADSPVGAPTFLPTPWRAARDNRSANDQNHDTDESERARDEHHRRRPTPSDEADDEGRRTHRNDRSSTARELT